MQINYQFPTAGRYRVRQAVDGTSGLPESIPGVSTGESIAEGKPVEAAENIASGVGEAAGSVAALAGTAAVMAGDNDPTMTPEEKESAAVSEKNHRKLTGEGGEEKSVGVDERPPRAGEGLSRAVGGTAQGVGAAAAGIGEGAGSAAKGAGEAVEGVGHAVKRLASVGEDERLRSNLRHQNPYVTDAGMSWGRGGETITTSERSAPTNPPEAMAAAGIAPGDVTQTTPVPQILPGPSRLEPDADHSAGTWTMSDIARYSIG